ncbi:DNA internalization-related competence protein ComEC/Rec2 [Streptococcus catagoni]|uniref:DNA internalization-related competence protein ComEC/Rec2 n=1 Tax=Streptococcus catagoni TaxID=2654874 RepID=UPI00140C5CCA|nr:DNA internalization-related competence protein ComEC/Rec2 [Streptococcus catagoni]
MISVWTKIIAIPPIQLIYLLILCFFSIYKPSLLLYVIDLFLIIQLFKNHSFKDLLKVLAILLVFIAYFTFTKESQEKSFNQQRTELKVVKLIPDTIFINGDNLSFKGENEGDKFLLFYKLKSKKEYQFFKKNKDFLQIQADIILKKADKERNFGGFNYQEHLKNQGIYRIGHIKKITRLDLVKVSQLQNYLSQWRRQAIVLCQEAFPKPMSHYMTGLLFGYLDKSFTSMTETYSHLGIIHLFALSGMQVSFFLNGFRNILKKIGIGQSYFPICEFIFSFFYAALTGYSVSVVRSLLQRNFSNIGIRGMTNFAFSFLVMFFLEAHFLLTVGGVLSYAYAFILSHFKSHKRAKLKEKVIETLTLSVGILPFLIFYFASFNPLSIILTTLFSLVFDIFMLPVLTLIFILSPLVKISFINPAFIFLEQIIVFVEKNFSSQLIFGSPNLLQFVLLIVTLTILQATFKQKKTRLALLLILSLIFYSIKMPLYNEVTVVDVGQGDSILIRDIYNKTLLIDVGGQYHFQGRENWQKKETVANAKKTLIPYLKSRGIDQIDQLLFTHTDTDHVGDMEEVVKSFKVDQILISSGSLTNKAFLKRLAKLRVRVKVLGIGDSISIMGSQLKVIYPWLKGDGKNNDSIVLYGKLLNQRFLFTGDLEKEGEKALIERYPKLAVDILKAAHHGSKGSSTESFIDHVKPRISLISAGKDNIYKHPHKETIERFKKRKIVTYRTDQNGAIRLKGIKKWQIETCH